MNDDACRNDCTIPVCGDGIVDPGEQCDDGNDVNDDACRNDCTIPVCGDGMVDPGEQCDDGNDINDDACRNDCTIPVCGDGMVDPGEQCDDGNDVNDDGCRNDCTIPVCGDGMVDPGEQCDDGNDVNDDGCRNDCTIPVCGDGMVDPGEQCDDGNNDNTDGCRNDCTIPVCGDGIVDPGEQCDDGNNSNDDDCSNECEFCGEPVVFVDQIAGVVIMAARDFTFYRANPQVWFQTEFTAGNDTFDQNQTQGFLTGSAGGDQSIILFREFVAAQLTIAKGVDGSCATDALAVADAWFVDQPVGSGVPLGDPSIDQALIDAFLVLQGYNDGDLCAPPVISAPRDAVALVTVANIGDVTLENINVVGEQIADCSRVIPSLTVGESVEYLCREPNITGDFSNTVSVTGLGPCGDEATDSDTQDVIFKPEKPLPIEVTAEATTSTGAADPLHFGPNQ